jgi:hypothetical protein
MYGAQVNMRCVRATQDGLRNPGCNIDRPIGELRHDDHNAQVGVHVTSLVVGNGQRDRPIKELDLKGGQTRTCGRTECEYQPNEPDLSLPKHAVPFRNMTAYLFDAAEREFLTAALNKLH